jgi:hypothetical protein
MPATAENAAADDKVYGDTHLKARPAKGHQPKADQNASCNCASNILLLTVGPS